MNQYCLQSEGPLSVYDRLDFECKTKLEREDYEPIFGAAFLNGFFHRGDIVPIQLDGRTQWSVGKGGYLAMTDGVVKETKSQGLGKAMFSGEGLFVHRVSGTGVLFVTSLGAIVQRQLRQGEQWIVDNGHLVAWTCPYTIERTGGGLMSGMHAGEGLVCRFTGPGLVMIQVSDDEAILIEPSFF